MFKAKWVLGKSEGFDEVCAIRQEVFVNSMGYAPTAAKDEFDGMSAAVLVLDESGAPVATGRLHPSAEGWKLGRIAVKKAARGKGYGDLVVRMLALKATETAPSAYLAVDAALSAVEFYMRYGFAAEGAERVSDGVTVQPMRVYCPDFKWNSLCGGCQVAPAAK